MHRTHWIVTLILTGLVAVSANGQIVSRTTAEAQEPVGVVSQPGGQFIVTFGGEAFQVLQEFREVLGQYPPTLRDMLRIDPALMLDPDFLAPYPALAEYLEAHPEIAHNPSYFLGSLNQEDWSEAVAITVVFLIIAGTLIWLIRTGIEYRRWSRASRNQAEVQAKLLDRFSASQDLLAYMETPAGRRFLEATPSLQPTGTQAPGAPMNRILWSIQAGLVLALGGWGLHYAIPRVADPGAADPLYVVGTLAIALGIGFVLSAGAALLLSRRFGLIQTPEQTSEEKTTRGPSSG